MILSRKQSSGFTLVEIMIVVAIIALLAAVAIPNLLRARHNANETAAIATCRTLSSAEESFRAAQNPLTDGNLNALSVAVPPYIDATLALGTKQGYTYAFTVAPAANVYQITATPVTVGVTGTRIFSVDQTGVVMDVNANLPVD